MGRVWLQSETETQPFRDARGKMQLQNGGMRLQAQRMHRHASTAQETRSRKELRVCLLNFLSAVKQVSS